MFLASTLALAAPLAFDPSRPPPLVGSEAGRPLYAFAPGVALAVTDGVVFTVVSGGPPPGAEPLGGHSWRLRGDDPIALASALAADPRYTSVFPDVILHRAPAFDDPSYGGQWYLQALEMEPLFAASLGDPGVRVAVIDSGIAIGHPDLGPAVSDPYDAWADDDDPSPDPGDEHGTAVAGVALARADNGEGIVGMCPACTLVPIKLLGEGSGGALSADIRAFEHAIASDAAVINNSWGFVEAIAVPEPLAAVIARATTEPRGGKGALVVFAAGNDSREIGDDELQALPGVLCVSAVDSYGYPTNYTNSGRAVDLAAPSATVSIAPDGVTTTFGGTSAAAPVASGLAAWALSVAPDLSAEELGELLIASAEPSPNMATDADGRNDVYGWGVLSATNVMSALIAEDPELAACACGAVGPAGAWGPLALGVFALLRRRR